MSSPVRPLPPLPAGKLRLGTLVFDNVDLLDIMGPMRIFGEQRNKLDVEVYFIGAVSDDFVTSSQTVRVKPDYSLDNAPHLDFFLIPGGLGTRTMVLDQALMAKIKKRAEEATYTLTVCTGAGVLAATGLADGYRMTTNKLAFAWPESVGPNVHWIKKARFVQDGKYVSSSGVSAGMDMSLHVISQLASEENAQEIADYIEYTWHKDGNDDPFYKVHMA
ncbi:hypothetical protein DFQ26_005048 [Actinomortierella ambigua]|nr:hypothetical protein DFQ26_005048 [Actinomortierella ambigua]